METEKWPGYKTVLVVIVSFPDPQYGLGMRLHCSFLNRVDPIIVEGKKVYFR